MNFIFVGAPRSGAAPQLAGGVVNALTALVSVLSLGMAAGAALAGPAAQLGIRAALTAVIAGGLVYALAGSTPAPAAAPSSATTVVFASLVAQLAQDARLDLASAAGLGALVAVLALVVVLTGALQVGFGLAGFGRLARYAPQPVLAGFMNGAALLIVLAQLRPLLGLPGHAALTDAASLAQIHPGALLLGACVALGIWGIGRHRRAHPPTAAARRWSPALVGLLGGVVVQQLLVRVLPETGFGAMVGALPQGWVQPDALLPLFASEGAALAARHAGPLLVTAAVLALVSSLETLLSAIGVDQASGGHHDSRRELLALGAANIASGLCGGMPVSLSRARAMNLLDSQATGRTPAVVAALSFGLMYALAGPLLAQLPRAVLAGVMLTIAIGLSDRWTQQLLRQWRAGESSPEARHSLALVAAVGAVTVFYSSVAGVALGVLLSMLVFVRSVNRSLLRARYFGDSRPSRRIHGEAQEAMLATARRRIAVFELEGALFFGSAARLLAECETLQPDCRVLVLDLRRTSGIDESGAMALQQLSARLRRRGIALLMAGVSADNRHGLRLRAFGCFREEPRADWWPDTDRAVECAERLLLAEANVAPPPPVVEPTDSTLFHALDAAQSARLRALLRVRHLKAGETVFVEGDAGDALYVLSEGSISIVAGAASGTGIDGGTQDQRYVSFSPGMMFGETAMLDGQGRSAAAVADTAATVYALRRTDFALLSLADPPLGQRLALNIALHLAGRLRGASAAWRASAG